MALILASQSPRRRELLGQMGLTGFVVRPAVGEEKADPSLSPDRLVEALSAQKGLEVAAVSDPGDLVIAADTVVAVDGQVLGKPQDRADALRMLAALSGRAHTVYTGVTLCRDGAVLTQHEATQVRFRTLTPAEMEAYVDTGEPMDKAGAYGIQEGGAFMVQGIRGSWSTVVGLPLDIVLERLLAAKVLKLNESR